MSGIADVGERGAVPEADERVDDRGRMDTTSIRSYASPKRKCASISSRPLFISVAESTVIFGPMLQVGARAPPPGSRRRARRAQRPRNGPPEAVRTSESTVSGSRSSRQLEGGRVLAVHRENPACRPAPGPRAPGLRPRRGSPCWRARGRCRARASRGWPGAPRSRRRRSGRRPARAGSSSSVRSPPTCVRRRQPVDRLRRPTPRRRARAPGWPR